MRAGWLAIGVLAVFAAFAARPSADAADAPPRAVSGPATAGAPLGRPAGVRWDERTVAPAGCGPVNSLHTFVATVVDDAGNPLPGQRVEWILARSAAAVGDIVAADDAPGKVGNGYAVSVTNAQEQVLDAATGYPWSDAAGRRLPDLRIAPGQSWVTVTSPVEGVTDVIAYVPGVRDASRNRVVARRVWADWAVRFPEDAVELLPSDARTLTVEVRRASDGAGVPGTVVEAEVLDGPDVAFRGQGRGAAVTTGADGIATFALENRGQTSGTNRVRLTAKGRRELQELTRTAVARVVWQRVALECACSVSAASVSVGEAVDVTVTVRNGGDAPAAGARLDLALPPGLALADGSSPSIPLGDLSPGAAVTRRVRLAARAPGAHGLSCSVTTARGGTAATCGCTVDVVQGALAVRCVCEPAPVEVDRPYQLVVYVANEGRGPLRNVRVDAAWPEGVTPRTQTTAAIPDLPPGRQDRFFFEGLPVRPGRLPASVRVTADGVPAASATCDAQVVKCLLEVEITAPPRVGFGEPGNFTARVHNRGDGPARGCVLRIVHGPCLGGGTREVPLGDIAPGADAAHDWSATGVANGRCAVSAHAAAPGGEGRGEAQVEVAGLPALHSDLVERSLTGGDEGIFRVGDEFLYVLEVASDAATDVSPPLRAILRLPPDLEYVGGAVDRGPTITPARDGAVTGPFTVPVGHKVALTFRVRARSVPPGNLVKVDASIRRVSDDAELAFESESTTITGAR